MADNGELERARERKRAAETQAIKGEEDRFAAEEEPTGDTKASAETIAGRRILRVKRPEGAGSATGLFANVAKAPPAAPSSSGPGLVTRGFGAAGGASASPAATPAAIPNPFAAKAPTAQPAASAGGDAAAKPAVSPTSLNAKPEAGGIPSVFGANSNFKFSFSAPPQTEAAKPAQPVTAIPASSSQPALQQQEQAEDPATRTLCDEPLKLYHKAGAEWLERGDVTAKVVINAAGDKPWAAVGAFASKTKRQVLSAPLGGGVFKVAGRADRQATVVVMEDGKPEMYIFRAGKDADARVAAFLAAVEAAEKELAEKKS
jgi:hypothetical protein